MFDNRAKSVHPIYTTLSEGASTEAYTFYTFTEEDIQNAIKLLQEADTLPRVTQIMSSEDPKQLFDKCQDARSMVYCGIPIYMDKNVPAGILRIKYSDGRLQDIPIREKSLLPDIKFES